jgi:hypothetical protein
VGGIIILKKADTFPLIHSWLSKYFPVKKRKEQWFNKNKLKLANWFGLDKVFWQVYNIDIQYVVVRYQEQALDVGKYLFSKDTY